MIDFFNTNPENDSIPMPQPGREISPTPWYQAAGMAAMNTATSIAGGGVGVAGGIAAAISYAAGEGGGGGDQFFNLYDEYIKPAKDYWTPDPESVSWAGKAVSDVTGLLPYFALGPGAVPAMVASSTFDTGVEMTEQRVTPAVASGLGIVSGVATAAMTRIPFVGKSRAQKMASGAIAFSALSAAQEAATKEILKSTGYEKLAEGINPYDVTNRSINLIMGGVFGGFAHYMQARKAMPIELEDAIDTVAAAQRTAKSSPFESKDIGKHIEAIDKAMSDMSEGKPVDVAALVGDTPLKTEPSPQEPEVKQTQEIAAAEAKAFQQEVIDTIEKSGLSAEAKPFTPTEAATEIPVAEVTPPPEAPKPTKGVLEQQRTRLEEQAKDNFYKVSWISKDGGKGHFEAGFYTSKEAAIKEATDDPDILKVTRVRKKTPTTAELKKYVDEQMKSHDLIDIRVPELPSIAHLVDEQISPNNRTMYRVDKQTALDIVAKTNESIPNNGKLYRAIFNVDKEITPGELTPNPNNPHKSHNGVDVTASWWTTSPDDVIKIAESKQGKGDVEIVSINASDLPANVYVQNLDHAGFLDRVWFGIPNAIPVDKLSATKLTNFRKGANIDSKGGSYAAFDSLNNTERLDGTDNNQFAERIRGYEGSGSAGDNKGISSDNASKQNIPISHPEGKGRDNEGLLGGTSDYIPKSVTPANTIIEQPKGAALPEDKSGKSGVSVSGKASLLNDPIETKVENLLQTNPDASILTNADVEGNPLVESARDYIDAARTEVRKTSKLSEIYNLAADCLGKG